MSSFCTVFALLLFIFSSESMAHPMDLGSLTIKAEADRLDLTLKIHTQIAVELTAKNVPEDLQKYSDPLLQASLGRSSPVYGGDKCHYRMPHLNYEDSEHQFLELHVVAVCLQAKPNPLSLHFPLPFLASTPNAFQLLTQIESPEGRHALVVQKQKPQITVGEGSRTFWSFISMGMGHIGATPDEWISSTKSLQWPEGLDHILFILALVASSGGLWTLFKAASGFTLGHSVTLALAVFNVIHIHSRWIDACIAMSIVYVAGASLLRRASSKHWIITGLFGAVHGLGFASALQDLELDRSEALWALLGFNLGVEFGQCLIIFGGLAILFATKKISGRAEIIARQILSMGLFLMGSYWFILRAIN